MREVAVVVIRTVPNNDQPLHDQSPIAVKEPVWSPLFRVELRIIQIQKDTTAILGERQYARCSFKFGVTDEKFALLQVSAGYLGRWNFKRSIAKEKGPPLRDTLPFQHETMRLTRQLVQLGERGLGENLLERHHL